MKVTVSSTAPIAGKVSVIEASKTLKARVTLVEGKATIALPELKKGTHRVTVTYSGSDTVGTARSAKSSIRMR